MRKNKKFNSILRDCILGWAALNFRCFEFQTFATSTCPSCQNLLWKLTGTTLDLSTKSSLATSLSRSSDRNLRTPNLPRTSSRREATSQAQFLFSPDRSLALAPTSSGSQCDGRGRQPKMTNFNEIDFKVLHLRVHTPMPLVIPNADFIQMWAIFGPTPGSFLRVSTVFGMSPWYSSITICDAALMDFAFVL